MCLVIPVEGDLHGGQLPVDAIVVFFDLVQIVVDIPVFRRGLAGRVKAGVYPHLRVALPQTVQKNLAAAQLRHADKELVDSHLLFHGLRILVFKFYAHGACEIGEVDRVLDFDNLDSDGDFTEDEILSFVNNSLRKKKICVFNDDGILARIVRLELEYEDSVNL